MKIYWMSAAHDYEINDLRLIQWLESRGWRVENISLANSNRYIALIIWSLNAILDFKNYPTVKDLNLVQPHFSRILRAKNISKWRKLFFVAQIMRLAGMQPRNEDLFIFRGNNNPLISILKIGLGCERTVILPHGIYFQDPLANNYFLDASKIVTSVNDWPGSNFKGRSIKIGLLEFDTLKKRNRDSRRVNMPNKQYVSICTTHSLAHQADVIKYLYSAIKSIDGLERFQFDLRVHPRNQDLWKFFPPHMRVRHLNKCRISDYIDIFQYFIFTRGFNNRISHVIYEAILLNKKVYIYDDDPESIENLPPALRSKIPVLKPHQILEEIQNNYSSVNNILEESFCQEHEFFAEFEKRVVGDW